MLVQSYSDEDYARLFMDHLTIDLSSMVWYLPGVKDAERLKTIDEMMHEVGFRRREKWRKTCWGWQAKIRRKE